MSDEKQPTAFDKWMESEDDRGYRFAAVEAVRNDLAAAFAAGQRSERVVVHTDDPELGDMETVEVDEEISGHLCLGCRKLPSRAKLLRSSYSQASSGHG